MYKLEFKQINFQETPHFGKKQGTFWDLLVTNYVTQNECGIKVWIQL